MSVRLRLKQERQTVARSTLVLLLAASFYVMPLILGFAWNSLGGPHDEPIPAAYRGRLPEGAITVEPWGSSVIVVPFHSRLRQDLTNLELPLWNPYQGLGQPFAGHGEGGPYFPLAILRALVSYSYSNWVTVLGVLVSALFAFLFFRVLGVSQPAATFGAVAWLLSGALSLHLPRDNLIDQTLMIPVLLWAVASADVQPNSGRLILLAIVSALTTLAGFTQIALVPVALVPIFAFTHVASVVQGWRRRLHRTLLVTGAFVLGQGLAAFSLLPMLSTAATSFLPGVRRSSIVLPLRNGLAFFFPHLFGAPLSNVGWGPTQPIPQGADWNNLFAFAGTAPLLVLVASCSIKRWSDRSRFVLFLFSLSVAALLWLHYLSVPPFHLIDKLPPFSQQAYKHTTGAICIFVVVAATLGLNELHRWTLKRVLLAEVLALVLFGALFLWALTTPSGYSYPGGSLRGRAALMPRFVLIAAFIFLLEGTILVLVAGYNRDRPQAVCFALTVVTIAELSLYIPLGTSRQSILDLRLGVSLLLVAAALASLNLRWRISFALAAAAIALYGVAVAVPSKGLPQRFDAARPPAFLGWLSKQSGTDFRSFGILPEFSALGQVQDIGAIGPMAPRAFADFVGLVGDKDVVDFYERNGWFIFSGVRTFPTGRYLSTKELFDWIGVRFLVFPPGASDLEPLRHDDLRFRVAYEDNSVVVVESRSARSKALFSSRVSIMRDKASILSELRRNPARINGPPMLEASAVSRQQFSRNTKQGLMPLSVESYRPNDVELSFNAPSKGVAVISDAWAPGWIATVDGVDSKVLRVNGFVRGVTVPGPGQHIIRFRYRPASFTRGALLAIFVIVLLSYTAVASWRRKESSPSLSPQLVGAALCLVLIILAGQAYFWVSR